MNLFDIMGIASNIPYESVQKLEADFPKFQQLMDLEKQAAPHVDALMPIVKQAEQIWASISPDVLTLMKEMENKT